jgi:hypothetical protein
MTAACPNCRQPIIVPMAQAEPSKPEAPPPAPINVPADEPWYKAHLPPPGPSIGQPNVSAKAGELGSERMLMIDLDPVPRQLAGVIPTAGPGITIVPGAGNQPPDPNPAASPAAPRQLVTGYTAQLPQSVVPEWVKVQVSARILEWPQQCACCCGPPDMTWEASSTRHTGKRVIREQTKSWEVPYCSRCVGHIKKLMQTFRLLGLSRRLIITVIGTAG